MLAAHVDFNLLQEWVSTTFRRGIGEVQPVGCPWASLTLAFKKAGIQLGPHGEDVVAESVLRQHLVEGYMNQSRDAVKAAIQVKIKSFFGRIGVHDEESAMKYWTWYLYSLSLSRSGPRDEDGAVCVPLDMADLQMLSGRFHVEIVVLQMMQDPVRLLPPSGYARHSIHLIHHMGLWAPLLIDEKQPVTEGEAFVDAVVKIKSDLSVTTDTVHKIHYNDCALPYGTVVAYEPTTADFIVCTGQQKIRVERSQIEKLIYNSSSDGTLLSNMWIYEAPWDWEASKKKDEDLGGLFGMGIPDVSLEWWILHEFVAREARAKLHRTQEELTSRSTGGGITVASNLLHPVPEMPERTEWAECQKRFEADQAVHALQGTGSSGKSPDIDGDERHSGSECLWVSLADVVEMINAGADISVFVVRPSHPRGFEGTSGIQVGDILRVHAVSEQWVSGVPVGAIGGFKPKAGESSWCHLDSLILWQTHTPFQPQENWSKDNFPDGISRYLPLEPGDTVVLTSRCEGTWEGWGLGALWGRETTAGLFHLKHLEPYMFVDTCEIDT